MAEALRIERREYKYIVDDARVDRIRHALVPFCELDPYALRAPKNRYTIESLYLDSPDLALYRANDIELVERYKLRVRHYPDAPGGPVFLETKSRYHDTIVKSRAMMGADWGDIISDPFVARARLGHAAGAERFVAHAHLIGARPTMLVRYTREAWVSAVDDYARVTFDREIQGRWHRPDAWSFDGDERDFRACDDATMVRDDTTRVVVELKFTAHVPRWMQSLVESLGLVRRSFSKYGRAIEAHYLATQLRTPRRPWVSSREDARPPRGGGRA